MTDYYARIDLHTNALRVAVEHAVLVDGKSVDGEFLDLLREVVENADYFVKVNNENAIKRLAELPTQSERERLQAIKPAGSA